MNKILTICLIVFGIGSMSACFEIRNQMQVQPIECNVTPVDVFGKDYSAADFKLWLKPTKEITYDMLADVTPIFDGTDIKDVFADKNYQGDPMVVFHFDEKESKEWEKGRDPERTEATGNTRVSFVGDAGSEVWPGNGITVCSCISGLPRWHNGKDSVCQCRRCKRHRFNPWVGKIPWRRI